MKLWKMKKSSDSDHEIMNLVEKNATILERALYNYCISWSEMLSEVLPPFWDC
jgi:hypothetical protein